MRRHADLLAVTALSLAGACGVLVLGGGIARLCCAVVLLFGAPGYALAAAAFPPLAVSGRERLVAALTLGLAAIPVGSVLLNAARAGLTSVSWTALALSMTFGGCAMAVIRRRGKPAGLTVARPQMRSSELVLLVLAGVAVSAGVAISRTPLPAKAALGYTQLWMLPAESGPGEELTIGVRSSEQRTLAYRVELLVGGNRRVIRSPLVLTPGKQFVQRVGLRDAVELSRRSRRTGIVTVLLYRLDRPDRPYRRVTTRLGSR